MTTIPSGKDMDLEFQYRYWLNTEIPAYLAKFDGFDAFNKAMPAAAASPLWKVMAYAMAKERWNVACIARIPA